MTLESNFNMCSSKSGSLLMVRISSHGSEGNSSLLSQICCGSTGLKMKFLPVVGSICGSLWTGFTIATFFANSVFVSPSPQVQYSFLSSFWNRSLVDVVAGLQAKSCGSQGTLGPVKKLRKNHLKYEFSGCYIEYTL